MKKLVVFMAIIFATIMNAQDVPTGKWFVLKNAMADVQQQNTGYLALQDGAKSVKMKKYNQRTLKGKKVLVPLVSAEKPAFPCTDEGMLFKFEKHFTGKYFIYVKTGDKKFTIQANNKTNLKSLNQDKKITTSVELGSKVKGYSYEKFYELMTVQHRGEGMWSIEFQSQDHNKTHVLSFFKDNLAAGTEAVGFVQKNNPNSWWVLVDPETGRKYYPQINEMGAE